MASRLKKLSGDESLSDKWSSCINKYDESDRLQLVGVYW